jgi:phosphohistidine phosphatase
MKTLYLVRHAKAINRNKPVLDFERSLRNRGSSDARRMAQYVKQHGPAPDVIVSSPAYRAIETARLFAETFNYRIADITTDETIYDDAEGSDDTLLHIVQALQCSHQTALMVGHDPLFSTFAHFLNHAFTDWLPTCGVVCFTFDVHSWVEVTQNRGTVRFFYSPKHEDPKSQLYEERIASQLADQLHQTLAEWHPEVANMMDQSLRKTGAKVAGKFVNALQAVQTKNQQRAISRPHEE